MFSNIAYSSHIVAEQLGELETDSESLYSTTPEAPPWDPSEKES